MERNHSIFYLSLRGSSSVCITSLNLLSNYMINFSSHCDNCLSFLSPSVRSSGLSKFCRIAFCTSSHFFSFCGYNLWYHFKGLFLREPMKSNSLMLSQVLFLLCYMNSNKEIFFVLSFVSFYKSSWGSLYC